MVSSTAATHLERPRVVVFGPSSTQVGGVATFMDILFSSQYIQERYRLIHLDTTRGPRGAGLEARFTITNIGYFVNQAIRFMLIAIRYRPKLMHVPVTSYWAFWKTAAFILMARVLSIKVVAHLHGGLFDCYYRESLPLIQRLIGWFIQRADVGIALSNWWKRFLLEEMGSNINIEVIPNTVDFAIARMIDNATNCAHKTTDMVLFVGSLGHRKGVFDILRAVPLVVEGRSDACFVFAGTEEKRGEQSQIDRVCEVANLTDAVRFLGQVTGQAKLDLFTKASIFVLPSHGENMPYVLLEAMGAGLPVITTPVGAIPELVEEGLNGFLIQPGDYHALADRIVRLLDDAPLRAAMSQANRDRIRDAYMPDVAMSRIAEVYSRLLDSSQE